MFKGFLKGSVSFLKACLRENHREDDDNDPKPIEGNNFSGNLMEIRVWLHLTYENNLKLDLGYPKESAVLNLRMPDKTFP